MLHTLLRKPAANPPAAIEPPPPRSPSPALRGSSRAYRRFLVFSHARSGSTMLGSALDGHAAACAMGELLHPDAIYGLDGVGVWDEAWMAWRNAHPVAFVRDVVFGPVAPAIHALGFKVFPEHLDQSPRHHALWQWLASEQDIDIIVLERQNLLAYYVSLMNARRSGRWQERGGQPTRNEALHVEPLEAEAFFQRRLSYRKRIERCVAGHRRLDLSYESLSEQPGASYSRLQAFLGLGQQPLQALTRKQAQCPLAEAISNWDALCRQWRGTPWEAFLR